MSPAVRYLILAAALSFASAASAQTTLSVSPTTVAAGGSVTATWSAIPSPTAWDWIALFTPGASDSSYSAWTYTGTTTPGGSLPFTIPSNTAPGTYQLRLFAGGVKRATSNNFSVLRAVTGTVSLAGSPLAGVAFTASNGGVCTTSNASGVYLCAVANGWSGTVTPTPTGYSFTPTSRSYSNVTTNQTAQNYTAVPYRQVSGTVTSNGLPLPNVAFSTGGTGSCTASNASGQYSCSVPDGWTGSVTPSQTGYAFTPSSKSYTAISADDPGEDYTASLSSPTSNISFIHVDHLNTPRLVANAAGTTVWRWDQQEPFGIDAADENPSSLGVYEMPLRFPGQYFDKETNNHYNKARDYWSEGGRYVQSDPIGIMGGINTYAYVYNNALSWIDPEGLAVWICNRKAWGVNAGVNHSYIWDGRSNRCCGMNRPYDPIATCKEKGPGPGKDSCNLVVGSDGKEEQIMKCCKDKANKSWWPKYDCHDLTNECILDAGLKNPGPPGGRYGECDSCSK